MQSGKGHLFMKPIVRVPLVLLVTAAAISLGVVGVHASTECVRFITKKIHHRVSAATAARWAAWDKAHPNWHPKKSPAETLAQLDFACAVPMIERPADGNLPPIELNTFSFPPDLMPPPETPPIVAMNEPPQDLFPDQPPMSWVSPPIYTPQYPSLFGAFPPAPPSRSVLPPPGLAPEPSSWMLLATSLLAIVTLAYRRPRTAKVVARRRL